MLLHCLKEKNPTWEKTSFLVGFGIKNELNFYCDLNRFCALFPAVRLANSVFLEEMLHV